MGISSLNDEGRDFRIIHLVHQDGDGDKDDGDDADIWALIGAAGDTAATVVLSTTGTYG